MRAMLGDEADAFFASYERPPISGLRVNTLKLTPETFRILSLSPLTPVSWSPAGFLIADDARPGKHPYHAAGLYYLQEPSAMAVAEAMRIEPGQRVLDLAAAPGGKATHIAALLAGEGVLVANEVVPSRVKPLGENLERWGATNAVITNEEPARLADCLGPAFDRVLLDAPCSGEGMFRKSPVAIREWNQEHVEGSAARQAKILADAARLTCPGGSLLYSTCTFSPDENEAQIARFLDEHPDWSLVDLSKSAGFASGRPEWANATDKTLERTIRLWPHLIPGEGHFLALLCNGNPSIEPRAATHAAGWERRAAGSARTDGTYVAGSWQAFAAESLSPVSAWLANSLSDPSRLIARNGALHLSPPAPIPLDGVKVVRPGLPLGAAKPGRFEPSHALALAMRIEDARNVADLSVEQAERYLAGETFAMPGPPGWTLVAVDGWPLGWGRRSGDVVKNHYPKGLRRPVG
jgi:16S rRNA C967 or C1407 C5-methylase (RsmB/RsmF family)/NOL1/NOP2/fmu family ribosome biogenesis protein